jgi:hypothetical protein
MATWLVKHKEFTPMKYLGTVTIKGKMYYKCAYTQMWEGRYYGHRDTYVQTILASECKLVRQPGKYEQKVRNFIKKLFTWKQRK